MEKQKLHDFLDELMACRLIYTPIEEEIIEFFNKADASIHSVKVAIIFKIISHNLLWDDKVLKVCSKLFENYLLLGFDDYILMDGNPIKTVIGNETNSIEIRTAKGCLLISEFDVIYELRPIRLTNTFKVDEIFNFYE